MDALRSIGRGLRMRCAACGRAPVFRTFFEAHEACPACGRPHASDRGDWVGGAEITLLLCAPALIALLFLVKDLGLGPFGAFAAIAAAAAVLVPLVYRRVKGFWLGVVYAWEGDDTSPDRTRDPPWFSDLWERERDEPQVVEPVRVGPWRW